MKKYKTGDIIKGYVTGIEKYGIFLSVDDFYTGLIHISEISNSFVKNIYDFVQTGEEIQARVIGVEEKSNRLKLSIKNVEYRPNRKEKSKIKETSLGFSTLKLMLNRWIETKKGKLLNKYEKKQKKD